MDAVDAHQHFWRYNAQEYGWLAGRMASLQQDYLPADWREHAAASGVVASVAVQARQSLEETRWLLGLAAEETSIAGVVGWADLRSHEFSRQLEELAISSKLVGLRHVVQDEPPGFMEEPAFNDNIARLEQAHLVYDLLIREHQLTEAIRFVDRHPLQTFVLDHAAKPLIASGQLEPWQTYITALARRGNVVCKISGLVTEADFDTWSVDDLRPYLDTLVRVFGPERLMAGSDWPVCLAASSFERWWSTLREYFAAFTGEEQHAVFRTTAETVYGLAVMDRGSQALESYRAC